MLQNTLHSDGDVLICATTALNLSRGMMPPLDFRKQGPQTTPNVIILILRPGSDVLHCTVLRCCFSRET